MARKARSMISYFHLVPGNGFLHKSEENRLVFVDPLQSHCRQSCVSLLCQHRLLAPAPSASPTANSPPAPPEGFVWPSPHHPWQNQPAQPILIISALRVIWLSYTEMGLDAITTASHQQCWGRGSPYLSKERVTGSWGCLEASPPHLAPERLERAHRPPGSLTGGAQFKLITSQAIKQSSADNHFWILWI